jgi:hypothetical protein
MDEVTSNIDEPSPAESEPAGVVNAALVELNSLGPRLQRLGFFLLLLTVANVLVSVLLVRVVLGANFATPTNPYEFGYAFGSLVITAIVLFSAAIFERLRKQGYVVYEEISEELQTEVRVYSRNSDMESEKLYSPSLPVRVALRKFHFSASPPLTPGRWGPAVYVGLNALLTFVCFSIIA